MPKALAIVVAKFLPRSSIYRRILYTRVIKKKHSQDEIALFKKPIEKQFCREAFFSQVICLGTSHMQYAFRPNEILEAAWNLAIPNCDFRTMYFIAKHALRINPHVRFVIGVDFWLKALQMEFTRDYPLLVLLDGLGIVPLQNRFMADELYQYGQVYELPISDKWVFDKGFWEGLDYSDTPVIKRVSQHLKFLKLKDTESIWFSRLIALCQKNGSHPVVVFPPARADYRALLPKEKMLFDIYRHICNGIPVLDLFSDMSFSTDDFGDTDHLNLIGATKFSRLINNYL